MQNMYANIRIKNENMHKNIPKKSKMCINICINVTHTHYAYLNNFIFLIKKKIKKKMLFK